MLILSKIMLILSKTKLILSKTKLILSRIKWFCCTGTNVLISCVFPIYLAGLSKIMLILSKSMLFLSKTKLILSKTKLILSKTKLILSEIKLNAYVFEGWKCNVLQICGLQKSSECHLKPP